MFYELT